MKKIGIVTITELDNFGNRLQNYALQEILKRKNFEVETIRNLIIYGNRKKKLYKITELLKGILRGNFKYRLGMVTKQRRFEDFDKKYFKFSRWKSTIDTIDEPLSTEYDYVIAGSDQIWNPYYPFNLDFNFLSFVEKEKRIAYAASFGVDSIPEEKQEQFKKWLEGMNHISVREFQGAKIFEQLTSKKCEVMPDPTLLLKKEEWLQIARKPKWFNKEEKYILKYFLGSDDEYRKILESLDDKYKELKIIDIHNAYDRKKFSITPDEFIYLINKSELMITDSFHGTVFSIIMQTPFVHSVRMESDVKTNSRIDSLFRMCQIKNDSLVCSEHLYDKKIDVITELQDKADDYLNRALEQGI